MLETGSVTVGDKILTRDHLAVLVSKSPGTRPPKVAECSSLFWKFELAITNSKAFAKFTSATPSSFLYPRPNLL